MICPRCESFAALVGELTLDRDHLRNELNKRKGDIVTTNNPGVVEQIRAGLTSAALILWMAEKYAEGGGSRSVEMEEFTQAKADIDAAIAAFSRLAPPCRHENLDMDGVCKSCGVDCRGIGADPLKGTAFAEAGRVVDALLNSPPSAQEQPASTPATTTPPPEPSTETRQGGDLPIDEDLGKYADEHCLYADRKVAIKELRHFANWLRTRTSPPPQPGVVEQIRAVLKRKMPTTFSLSAVANECAARLAEISDIIDSPPSSQEQPASTPATTTPPASATEAPATEADKALEIAERIFHRVNIPGGTSIRGLAAIIRPLLPLPAANTGESKVAELEKRVRELEAAETSMRDYHEAAIKELYRIFGVDGSDGEYRFKWVAVEANTIVSELERLRGVLQTAMEHLRFHQAGHHDCLPCKAFAELESALSRATPPAPPRDKGMAETQGQGEGMVKLPSEEEIKAWLDDYMREVSDEILRGHIVLAVRTFIRHLSNPATGPSDANASRGVKQ